MQNQKLPSAADGRGGQHRLPVHTEEPPPGNRVTRPRRWQHQDDMTPILTMTPGNRHVPIRDSPWHSVHRRNPEMPCAVDSRIKNSYLALHRATLTHLKIQTGLFSPKKFSEVICPMISFWKCLNSQNNMRKLPLHPASET